MKGEKTIKERISGLPLEFRAFAERHASEAVVNALECAADTGEIGKEDGLAYFRQSVRVSQLTAFEMFSFKDEYDNNERFRTDGTREVCKLIYDAVSFLKGRF